MILRPYQTELLDGARKGFKERIRAILLQLATGGGKTVSGSYMIKGASQRGKVCWWLAHRRELIAQTSKTFASMGIPHGIIQSGRSSDPHKLAQIGSVQTVSRRLDKLTPPDLIIFDECHHLGAGQWQAIFEAFPNAKIIGLTATPWRLDGKGLGNWFGRMVNGPSVSDLIAEGALSKYRLFSATQPDLSSVGTQAGEFKRDQLAELMDKPSIVGDAVQQYQKNCAGKRAVVFAVNIEHSKHIALQFQLAGIAAEHVDGTMDAATRDGAIRRFVDGETKILSNVELFGEGFDVPAIEAVILMRPTKSLSLYLQQVGRALRPAPGKEFAYILDHAGNSINPDGTLNHGFPDDDREWSLEDREKRRASEKAELTVRTCPDCFAVFRPAPQCPNCGHAYVAQVREIEQVDGELAEVDVEALRRREMADKKREQGEAQSLDDLIRVGRSRNMRNPEAWARNVIQGREEAQRFADALALTPPQVKQYRKEGMPAASKGIVAALLWIRAEKPAVFQWIEREHPEVMSRHVLAEIGLEMAA